MDWLEREEARKALDKRRKSAPFEEKVDIVEKLKADCEALRGAVFGLGELPPDAANEYPWR